MELHEPLIYKIAEEPHEFELIHRLNYRTFVEEIPQHAPNGDQRLVDRFHEENTYIICMRNERLLGMIALRGRRPFSLDYKLADLNAYLPANSNPLEIRLLAIEPDCRRAGILFGMVQRGVEMARARSYDLALISGTTRQTKLYRHIGFRPFGPLVGSAEAMFQPMYLTWDAFEAHVGASLERRSRLPHTVSFLPGPVTLSRDVQRAFMEPAVSHRAPVFVSMLEEVKRALRRLTGANEVAVLQGSGTLANDVVGGQLSLSGEAGLILSNGEFGERLCDHAQRFGLGFTRYAVDWGQRFDLEAIDRVLRANQEIRWLWAVHCETSTGVLNDLAGLKALSRRHGLKLCLDCVSSLGGVAVDLSGVNLASATIGKAVGAPPGLALVFADGDAAPPGRLPRYLDLSAYLSPGAPFTISSNLVSALRTALETNGEARFDAIAQAGERLRRQLEMRGVVFVSPRQGSAPHVLTIEIPAHIDTETLANRLAARGALIAYASDYLKRRNWIQICLMGDLETSLLDRLALMLVAELQSFAAPPGGDAPSRVRLRTAEPTRAL